MFYDGVATLIAFIGEQTSISVSLGTLVMVIEVRSCYILESLLLWHRCKYWLIECDAVELMFLIHYSGITFHFLYTFSGHSHAFCTFPEL